MALTKILPADLTGKGVVGLPDTPGLSTTEMQEKFDEIANDVLVPKHNSLVDDLEATTGAGNIGALSSGGTASNIQAELDNRYTISVTEQLLNNKVDTEEGKGLTTNDFTDGFKFKLNGIEDNANNYVLPKGTQSTLGGVMGDGTTFTIDEDGYGHAVGGGGGGTSDYTALINKPKLNDITITGSHDSEYYGLLRPYLVVTSEAGSTVTISKGGETITATQISGSTTTWEVRPTSYGTWTVSSNLPGADIATSTITIDAVKTYAITVEHITSTITVTYESGATCTCSKGSTVYTATSNPQTFTVRSIGNWVISVTYDGLTKTVTVPITADAQSESVTVEFADIEVTYGNAFRGTTITCACGETVYSKTAPSNANTVSFTIPTTGTWRVSGTVSGDTYNQDVVVSAMTSYSATLQVFNATVTVTFPYTEGASCTLSDGTTTLTATTSPMAFSVPNVGTWTATCTLDGQAKTDSAVITTDGQTESLTFAYGTINLTYDNEFRGMSITCTDNDSTITKTAPISGNSMSFYPPSTGTWTISGVYSGVTYTTTATVSSLSTAVTAQLQTTPNGSTITPTDDIQIWLNCAGIYDKNYTTLGEVLADTTTFDVLLRDSNACDYMARSTTWASTICADADAMARVGKYDYCSDKLLSNSTWCTAICNSTYFESVLNVKIPVLTANNQCIASSYYTSNPYETFRMFDGKTSTIGTTDQSYSATNLYVGYDFGTDVHIHKIKYVNSEYTGSATFKLRGSDDNSTYNDVSDDISITTSQTKESVVTNFASYRYWVIKYSAMTAAGGGAKAPNICELQFYGRKPAQTDIVHTAPYADVYYMNNGTQTVLCTADGNGVGSVDWSDLDAGTYTLYSTVAKNPSDLSADYSKSVKITNTGIGGTTEVWLMPEVTKTLYWYGYMSENCEVLSTTNGWSRSTGFLTPTFNTNNMSATGNSSIALSGLGTKNAITGNTAKAICISASGNSNAIRGNVSKNTDGTTSFSDLSLSTGLTSGSISGGNTYMQIVACVNSSIVLSAWWYE